MGAPGDLIAAHRERVWVRRSLDRLGPHIAEVYGVEVTGTTELDVGVIRIDLADRQPWVARVFSTARSADAARNDAAVLRHVAASDFPAERLAADEPLSTLDGQPVLVTTFVVGRDGRPDYSVELSRHQGDLLGRLHALPRPEGDAVSGGGAWHGLSPNGGTRDADVAAVLPLLDDAAALHPDRAAAFETLRDAVAGLDVHADLPRALTHPDFTGPNMLLAPGREPVVVDWTGSGIGPRVLSLGMILERGSLGPDHGDAIAAAYREHVALHADELTRLPDAIRAFGLLMACWTAIFRPDHAAAVATKQAGERAQADAIAHRFRAALGQ